MYATGTKRRSMSGFQNWVVNAATGKLSPEQRDDQIADCARQVQRASGGRLTYDQAQTQCGEDINAVVNLNGGVASNLPDLATNTLKWTGIAVLAVFGATGLIMAARHA